MKKIGIDFNFLVYKIKNYKNETQINDMDSFFSTYFMIFNFDNFFKNFSFLENRIFKDEDDYKITNFFYNRFLFSIYALIYSNKSMLENFIIPIAFIYIDQNLLFENQFEDEAANKTFPKKIFIHIASNLFFMFLSKKIKKMQIFKIWA